MKETRQTKPDRSEAGKAVGRRALLAAALPASPLLATPFSRHSLLRELSVGRDAPVIISRARLDALVAKAYPRFNIPEILPASPPPRFAARYDIALYRLDTFTRMPETSRRVRASGLLAVPLGPLRELPVVSWQHGTILSFNQVPSNLLRLADPGEELSDDRDSLETLFNLHRLAGQGFAVVAADYIGKGPWRETQGEAYAVKAATVQCCVDVLDAGLELLRRLGHPPGALFLNGWSQGGLNTQWLFQTLQARGRLVTAAAAQSPFHNLVESLQYWTGSLPGGGAGPDYPTLPNWVSLCVIIVLGSYREHLRMPSLFAEAIRVEYRDIAERWWRNYDLKDARLTALPPASGLLVDGFWERFTGPTNSQFLRALARAGASPFVYRRPLRLYYGLADEALHPKLMGMALAGSGPDVEAMPVAGASHRGTFLASLYGEGDRVNGRATVTEWFRSFLPSAL